MNYATLQVGRSSAVFPTNDVNPGKDRYLDLIEAARLFGIAKRELDQWVCRGHIPVHLLQVGKRSCRKFKLSELLAWAAAVGFEVSPQALQDLLSRRTQYQ